jgi:hypothetical protein
MDARRFQTRMDSRRCRHTLVSDRQSPTPPYGRAMGQEEIIFVSDDRVLTLRMAAQTGQ